MDSMHSLVRKEIAQLERDNIALHVGQKLLTFSEQKAPKIEEILSLSYDPDFFRGPAAGPV